MPLLHALCRLWHPSRRIAEQRAEAAQLQEQVTQLQSDLAASHAAHLALQQHHTATVEVAAQEKQDLEEQHRKAVEALQQVSNMAACFHGVVLAACR